MNDDHDAIIQITAHSQARLANAKHVKHASVHRAKNFRDC